MKWDNTLCGGTRHTEEWKLKATRGGGAYHCNKGHVDRLHHGGWCIPCKDNDEANLVWVEVDDPKGKPVRLQPYTDLPPLESRAARWQCCECDSQALPDDYLCGQCREAVLYS